jgi:hypothetical protein
MTCSLYGHRSNMIYATSIRDVRSVSSASHRCSQRSSRSSASLRWIYDADGLEEAHRINSSSIFWRAFVVRMAIPVNVAKRCDRNPTSMFVQLSCAYLIVLRSRNDASFSIVLQAMSHGLKS